MKKSRIIDIKTFIETSPEWPTNYHEADFWEALGRTVATISFLEEILKKSILVISGSKQISSFERKDEELSIWLKKLEIATSDPLGALIKKYEQAVRSNEKFLVEDFGSLISELELLKEWRNILCHGSWRPPGNNGKSNPFFIKKNGDVFSGDIDTAQLNKVRTETVKIICNIINSITTHGIQFPGTSKE